MKTREKKTANESGKKTESKNLERKRNWSRSLELQ